MMDSYKSWKFKIFLQSNLSVFSSIASAFGVISKKSLAATMAQSAAERSYLVPEGRGSDQEELQIQTEIEESGENH